MNSEAVGATRQVAHWAAELQLTAVESSVVSKAEQQVVDFFRVIADGAGTAWTSRIRNQIGAFSVPDGVIVPYLGDRLDPPRAAFLGGCLAHAIDLDDTHVQGMIHPGATVIPAALSVAQLINAGGADFMSAVICGYETSIRLSVAIQPSHFERGFQSTGTCGTIGAAVAAAKLLRLSASGIADAMGLAASYAGGIAQFYASGSDVKRTHAGRAAEGGTLAAHLASGGVTGPHDALEGEWGFAHAFAGIDDISSLTAGLGEEFVLGDVISKSHSASARIQASIDASMTLRNLHRFHPNDISQVVVGIPEVIAGRLTDPAPHDLQAAQMSLPFSVALALSSLSANPSPDFLTVDDYVSGLESSLLRQLSSRVECRVDSEISAQSLMGNVPSKVVVTLNDGSEIKSYSPQPTGDELDDEGRTRPMSGLQSIASKHYSPSRQEVLIDQLNQLSTLSSLDELIRSSVRDVDDLPDCGQA